MPTLIIVAVSASLVLYLGFRFRRKARTSKDVEDLKEVPAFELVISATNSVPDPRFYERDKLVVKFSDRHTFRLRGNHLAQIDSKEGLSLELNTLLVDLPGAAVVRLHSVNEEQIDRWVANARQRSKGPIADLNNYFIVLLDKGQDSFEIASRFLKLSEVQFARPLLKPVPPPQRPGNFTTPLTTVAQPPYQRYLQPSPTGIDAIFAWTIPGGDGAGTQICDIEYNWNFSHKEFTGNGGLVLLGQQPSDPTNDMSHGTAVVGVYGSNRDVQTVTLPGGGTTETFLGTTGISFNAGKFAAAVFTNSIYNIPNAITVAMNTLVPGDILLIEQHLPGPDSDYSPGGVMGMIRDGRQGGFVPVEWYLENYDAIRCAVENAYIVVEAAGNGGEDLDSSTYNPDPNRIQRQLGIEPHTPFAPGHDSGAIIVGAGDSNSRSRASFSNFGRRVDVQAWGDNVVTTEAPGRTSNPDLGGRPNEQYTSSFNGTSSASPIIAGACAVLQGVYQNLIGRKATPSEIREFLQQTNSSQTGDTSQHIGPLPDLRMAIQYVRTFLPAPPWMPPGGSEPLPFALPMIAQDQARFGFRDVKVWFTLNGTEPNENTANLYVRPFRFTEDILNGLESIEVQVRARTFATNSRNIRVASPLTKRVFGFYQRLPPPANFRASQGAFSDRIKFEWDSIDDPANPPYQPSTYDLYMVTGSAGNPHYYRLTDEPTAALTFDHVEPELPPQVRLPFVVVGTRYDPQMAGLEIGRLTEYSAVAEGWVSPPTPQIIASKGEFTNHVLVRWEQYSFGNALYDLSTEYLLYRSEQSDRLTALLIAHLEKTYRPVLINGIQRAIPVPAPTFYQDETAAQGRTYYYWLKVKGQNPDGQAVETPFSNADSGYLRQ